MVDLAINIVAFIICAWAAIAVGGFILCILSDIYDIYKSFAHDVIDFIDNMSDKIRKMMGVA
jgi:hypothetical protein